ncbi:phage baseplate assembly protein V [Hafnia alvei]|uniref:Bacteriophage Mu Gp45 protein n=1 Tax=Hafnia alvei ATCC 51873 TaxID=1002364 RepID=G9Y0H0_HAFAL|nr:phage baseplate assembly protein V [Hafnia alvei]EHM48849.1 bacteriophage Mu Gp45 protein [Hafnia alvei ATCC 51873]QQE44203.1 phage baseplate assembly protein V [Hafnia alvei]
MPDFSGLVDKRIRKALSGLRLAFRGVLTRITTKGGVQTAQVSGLAPEGLEGIEIFQQYGFTTVPPEGAMAIVLPLGGRTSHGIVIATEHSSYRLQGLESGEVAIYTDEGASIVLKRNRIIAVDCDEWQLNCKKYAVNASESAIFTTPELSTSKKLTAQGLISGNGGMAIKGGEGGVTASFEGNISHTGGAITSVAVTINGVKIGTHIHDTPDGPSGKPHN